MKKKKTSFRLALAFLCAALPTCGKNSPEPKPSDEQATVPGSAADEAEQAMSSQEQRTGETPRAPSVYKGELTFSEKKHPWGEKAAFTFEVEGGTIVGQAEIFETFVRIRGVVEDGAVRAWLGSDRATEEAPRAGYMYGKIEDGSASGTFSISAVQAEATARGTWAAELSSN